MKTTEKERDALRRISEDDIYQEAEITWVQDLFETRERAGAFASACKKGLAWTDGESCGLTKEGKQALAEESA